MLFRITMDATFEAENIDDAFQQLSLYFATIYDEELDDVPQIIRTGEVHIVPIVSKGD
jgi:hypothetical protein